MTQGELLDSISQLSLVDQVALVEAILGNLKPQLQGLAPPRKRDREELRRQMARAAQEAEPYYRNDPELTIWQALDGEPLYEYDAESNLAGEPGSDPRRRNDENTSGTDHQ